MKAKLIMLGVGLVLFLVFVLPGIMNIGDGYKKDMSEMTDIDKMQSRTINEDHPFISMTPNGSKAVVKQMDVVNSFFEGLAQLLLMLMLFAAGIFVLYLRQKSKEEDQQRQNFDRRHGKGSYDRMQYRRY